jgi:hypothetical protein
MTLMILVMLCLFFILCFYSTHKICLPYISNLSKMIISVSLCTNCFFLYIFILDVQHSFSRGVTFSLKNLWRLVYWSNFIFGFIIFPILTQSERNHSQDSILTLLYTFYKKRLLILVSIVVPLVILAVLIFDVSVMSLFTKQTLLVLPIFLVIIWGFLLLNLHISLALNHIPKMLSRKINFYKELGILCRI